MKIVMTIVLAMIGWAGFTTLEAEAEADACYFDADTLTNKSVASPCSVILWDITRFWGCPCKIDMNLSILVWPCAGFRVSVNGEWVQNPSSSFQKIYNLDCGQSHHSFAMVSCTTSCGGVNQSYIVAEYKGDCTQPCNGQGPFLQSGPPPE